MKMLATESKDLGDQSRTCVVEEGFEWAKPVIIMLPPAVTLVFAEVLKYNSRRLAPSYVKKQARQGVLVALRMR